MDQPATTAEKRWTKLARRTIAASHRACEATDALIASSHRLIAGARGLMLQRSHRRSRGAGMCHTCGRGITPPAVMVVRGPMVMHAACDAPQASPASPME